MLALQVGGVPFSWAKSIRKGDGSIGG